MFIKSEQLSIYFIHNFIKVLYLHGNKIAMQIALSLV